MLSPMMTVFVLAVLWLIVVVPMIFRRNDARRRERSVARFGGAMRALGGRSAVEAAGGEVFVPRARAEQRERDEFRQNARRDERSGDSRVGAPVVAARKPVPSAQEALMHPVDRSDMSESRRAMMRRRRRSLGVLVGGTLISFLLGYLMGGALWIATAAFATGLGGYLYFLRSMALRDKARRAHRLERATEQRNTGFDATEEIARFEEAPASVVRIDDDDIELHNMETIDLTGIYDEELATGATAAAAQRRAS